MKKKIYTLGAAALMFFVSGCDQDFLDKKPTQQLTPEQIAEAVKTDPDLLAGNVAGLYSMMYDMWTGGTTRHDDFGQKGYDIFMDMLSSDMALVGTNYGWYTTIVRYQATTDFTRNEAYTPWRYYYRMVRSANNVIDLLGGTDAEPEGELQRHIMGQAKAMRAYAYFYLSQLYAPGYGTGSEKILPIYTDAKMPNQPKSTSAEVYNLMVDDLTQAIEYLEDFNRSSKEQVDKNVAKGLLVYVLSARGTNADLAKVVTLTNEILTEGGYSITSKNALYGQVDASGRLLNPESGFNNVASPSWIWGVDLTLDSDLDLVSWWGQIDLFTYSYAWAGDPKKIDASLQASIRPDDLRRKQFSASGWPYFKFFDPARVQGGQRNVVTDYVYMRMEEMMLMNAEAQARLGNDAAAKAMLLQLMSTRIEEVAGKEATTGVDAYTDYLNTLSNAQLIDEIFLQTRIELWGEGKSYLAMKRLKKSITRGANHLFFAGETFSWDDDEMTFPIPQAEVQNNPVLEK
ncbi:RagB/SusD family nutrient uptake outer membrane protein [Pontibacter sp. Tf4]|uniref:RagB/SusD family nutrient uptake outer membrane protein n=1 Tax=Pontibacter sp. Tf4 TaxID=2761620 RepID=UPI001623FDF4|nr:RagB/SusD family nutrient uptake outer membrane protein [Pontibacter sp. Tf4]MBB6611439.1 RagB/SusD family nutrient uptake outer membrane protein [Pontibacter sp. Tf4]